MTDEERITKALVDAKDTIQELSFKLSLAIEVLEEYSEHVIFDAFPWAKEPAIKVLKDIKGTR